MLKATLLYGGLVGALWALLSANVSRLRMASHWYGPPSLERAPLYRATRAHGNLAESAPLVLLLLALCEWTGAPSLWVHALGGTYLVARLCHAASWAMQPTLLRKVGATLTVLVLGALACLALYLRFEVRP